MISKIPGVASHCMILHIFWKLKRRVIKYSRSYSSIAVTCKLVPGAPDTPVAPGPPGKPPNPGAPVIPTGPGKPVAPGKPTGPGPPGCPPCPAGPGRPVHPVAPTHDHSECRYSNCQAIRACWITYRPPLEHIDSNGLGINSEGEFFL